MKGFANDNGCRYNFNKNSLGICQYCHSRSSDCLLYGAEFALFDQYIYNLAEFNYKEINKSYRYKDYATLHPWNKIWRKFSSKGIRMNEMLGGRDFNEVGGSFLGINNYEWLFRSVETGDLMTNELGNLFFYRNQSRMLSNKCYDIHNNNSGYSVSAKAEYSLANAKDSGYDISKQKEEIRVGPLTELLCVKPCLVGYFYEFESISCRKCNMGCGVCASFDECETCNPGYNKIQNTRDHQDLQVEGFPVGMCRPGCQPGFYPVRFKGNCRECQKTCLICRDKINIEVARSKEKGIENDIYCIQCREKNDEGRLLYSDLLTGECVDRCEGFSKFALNITNNRTRNSYMACGGCYDPNCEDCQEDIQEGACIRCREGYVVQSDGSCLFYWRTNQGMMIISLITAPSLMIAAIFGFGAFCKCLRKGFSRRRRRRNLKTKKASTLVYKTQGTDNQQQLPKLNKFDTYRLKDLRGLTLTEKEGTRDLDGEGGRSAKKNLFGKEDDSIVDAQEMISLKKLPSLGYSRTRTFKKTKTLRSTKNQEDSAQTKTTKMSENHESKLRKDTPIDGEDHKK